MLKRKAKGLTTEEQTIINLFMPADDNVGKTVRFTSPKCAGEEGLFTIVACQKVWGYDADGNFVIMKGYRGITKSDKIGRPFHLDQVYFTTEKLK